MTLEQPQRRGGPGDIIRAHMRGLASLPRSLLRIAAILFAAATVLYSALWMRYIRVQPQTVIGIEYEDSHVGHLPRVIRVLGGSGAEAAGVRPGDLVRAIDGRTVTAYDPLRETVVRSRPGDVVRLTIERSGEPALVDLPVVLGPLPAERGERTPARAIASEVVASFPVVFLVVGFTVLFLRLQDRNAWLPVLLFAGFIGPTSISATLSIYFFGAASFALASLVWNGLRAPTSEARRKTRVIVWGTVAGILPFMALNAAAVAEKRDPYSFPFWVWVPSVLAVLLLPLSFAYAIIKHRVLEIPLLLKRGARYLLVQRGFTVLLILASAALTLLFADWS